MISPNVGRLKTGRACKYGKSWAQLAYSTTQGLLCLGAPLLGDGFFVSADGFFGSADSFFRGVNDFFASADGSADGFFGSADGFFVSADGSISGWRWSWLR